MIHVTVLGSGASLPTLHRHTAATAMQREGDVWLFDCGEGTQMQWRRAGLRFSKLRGICVSHLHGDHVNGLVGLLQTLSLADRVEPLSLYGPPGISSYIQAARRHLGLRLTYELAVEEHTEGVFADGDGYELRCAILDHGVPTLGFAFIEEQRPGRFDVEAAARLGVPEGPLFGRLQRGEPIVLEDGTTVRPEQVLGSPRPGKSVAICVDTRPCAAAVDLARDADLFLCDATFGSELAVEAAKRGHCTAAQAAEMAKRAGARRLLLVHVSARYHDARPLLDEARSIFPDTDVAEDLMEIEA